MMHSSSTTGPHCNRICWKLSRVFEKYDGASFGSAFGSRASITQQVLTPCRATFLMPDDKRVHLHVTQLMHLEIKALKV